MSINLFSVWDGIYNNFDETGQSFDAFNSDIWINKQKKRIHDSLLNIKSNKKYSKDYPMSLTVAILLSIQENVSILDFGGGMGLQYLDLVATIPEHEKRIKYHVVDGKSSIENKPKILDEFKNLNFYYNISDIKRSIDIIHIGSTLQYIDDWRSLIVSLLKEFKPKYFIFSDLFVGDVPTFVTNQKFYDDKIPNRFINIDEFMFFITDELNLRLIFKTKFIREILDQEKIFPNFGLPEVYQIDRPYHMVFVSK